MINPFLHRYEKARGACALFHLEDWAAFRLSGKDTRDFLNRISTADVRKCGAGEGLQTLFLQGDGRIVADCAVLCESDETFHLLCPAACRSGLAQQLERFLFSEKVTIIDGTEEFYMGMVIGPARHKFAEALRNICLDSKVACEMAEVTFAPSAPRTLLLIDKQGFQEVREALYAELEKCGGVVGDVDLFETLRVEDGCPMYGKDTSIKSIPLEANQKPAISFTKGCFPGQEIVARINNLGHPANVLVGLLLPETTEEMVGRELKVGEKTVGRITSTCYSPAFKAPLGLGYVKWNHREAGQTIEIAGDGNFQVAVVDLPLSEIPS